MEAATETKPTQPAVVIEPVKGWRLPNLRELLGHWDLFYYMARRDIVIRYKQAVVGVAWAILQPLFMAGLFAIFLGLLQRVPSEQGIPYGLFAVSGLVLWIPFTVAINQGTLSTVINEQLITKIYFPRVLIPLATACAPVLDMVIGIAVVIVFGMFFGVFPDIRIIAVPFCILLTLIIGSGIAVWFSALNVKYRDAAQLVGVLSLAGLFITPITYPFYLVTTYLPAGLEYVYALNPMVGVLELFRWSVLGTGLTLWLVWVPIVMAPVLLFTGLLYFARAEREFADVI
jgi:lipopolysaccharide transport system permease protein